MLARYIYGRPVIGPQRYRARFSYKNISLARGISGPRNSHDFTIVKIGRL